VSLNPDYLLRMAKQIQEERIEAADRFRKARQIEVEDGWWRSPVRWQKPADPAARRQRAS